MLIDLVIFQIMISGQSRLGSAHVASFFGATITNFVLNYPLDISWCGPPQT